MTTTTTSTDPDPAGSMAQQQQQPQRDSQDESTVTMNESASRQIHRGWLRPILDPSLDAHQRCVAVQRLLHQCPVLASAESEAHVRMYGPCQVHGPNTVAWSSSPLLRKAYTVLMWIRPVIFEKKHEDDNENENSDDEEQQQLSSPSRIVYRMANAAEDTKATGVCVTCTEWTWNADGGTVSTTLTAFSLPHHKPSGVVAASLATYSSYCQTSLTLQVGVWQLLGFTHVQPYVKRPAWTVTVNGGVQYTGHLHYPAGPAEMDHVSWLCGVVSDQGAIMVVRQQQHQSASDHPHNKRDDEKTASELQQESAAAAASMEHAPRRPMALDVAAMAIYPVDMKSALQAVAAEAGPNLAHVASGRILTWLPPVPNWSKGSSLEGPKVGIPMAVHGAALDLQIAASQVLYAWTALNGRYLGDAPQLSTASSGDGESARASSPPLSSFRILIPMRPLPGDTAESNRVGLLAPSSPAANQRSSMLLRLDELEEEDPHLPSLYVTGRVVLYRAAEHWEDVGQRQTRSSSSSVPLPLLTVALQEGDVLSACLLPFFLSLGAPGAVYELQQDLFVDSVRHLHALYHMTKATVTAAPPQIEQPKPQAKDDASTAAPTCLAAQLIDLLAAYILTGARAQEHVLQAGAIHILASSLRLSLLRAEQLDLFGNPVNGTAPVQSVADLLRRAANRVSNAGTTPTTTRMLSTVSVSSVVSNSSATMTNATGAAASNSSSKISPRYIPPCIVEACVRLLAACTGPPAPFLDQLVPAWQVRRTSDLGLTALFGLALDGDLWWGPSSPGAAASAAVAAAPVLEAIAARYGGVCPTAGYIVRGQMSVQYFLDAVRMHWDRPLSSNNTATAAGAASNSNNHSQDLERVAQSLSQILLAMLLSSLSNPRNVSQGEHDIAACMGALTDTPLGSVAAHTVLAALIRLLTWCDVLPLEAYYDDRDVEADAATTRYGSSTTTSNPNDRLKMHVASRLGRNLLMSEFHDVIAPMLLSRTVFSGERTAAGSGLLMQQQQQQSQPQSTTHCDNKNDDDEDGSNKKSLPLRLCWQQHWRYCLLLFSWGASIAGAEGVAAARSCGGLMLAAGFAGSLHGALERAHSVVLTTLFIPSPAMALMIGSTLRNEWSYTDLLADRLQIMMPLLPGMVVSLLTSPAGHDSTHYIASVASLAALSAVLTAAGGAFHRVFGGTIHNTAAATSDDPYIARRQSHHSMMRLNRQEGAAEACRAAKNFVPHLLVVSMLLEHHIRHREEHSTSTNNDDRVVQLVRPEVADEKRRQIGPDAWEEISGSSESVISELAVAIPDRANQEGDYFDAATSLNIMKLCQASVLNTASGLVTLAMALGGAGFATPMLQIVLQKLQETVTLLESNTSSSSSKDGTSKTPDRVASAAAVAVPSSPHSTVARTILCRMVAQVLLKALKRHYQWDILSFELSSSMARVMALIEEKDLLRSASGDNGLNPDQISLLGILLDVLAYGRDSTGWCQLPLPAMSSSTVPKDMSGPSRLLLPLLQPCLRIVLNSLQYLSNTQLVLLPPDEKARDGGSDEHKQAGATTTVPLLVHVTSELDRTLTAAIVGLSFSTARDVALHAMANLRLYGLQSKSDSSGTQRSDTSTQQLGALLVKVADELRVRYESERRIRNAALFDAYDNDAGKKEAVEASQAIERLILGGDMFGLGSGTFEAAPASRAITTGDRGNPSAKTQQPHEDFVLFHRTSVSGSSDVAAAVKLGFAQYEGLGAALEHAKAASELSPGQESELQIILATLAPYLDAWDAVVAQDAAETELVDLFDTSLCVSESQPNCRSELMSPIVASETAADAMSTFFEFAAAEKSRMRDIFIRFLPSLRNSRISFAERYCWARFMEWSSVETFNRSWERAVPDGNRDIRSRLSTVPCAPQFRRYIPKYLDHSSEDHTRTTDNSTNVEHGRRGSSSTPGEIGSFTKFLLETAGLEIVDVTKKESPEDDDGEPDLYLAKQRVDSIDDDEGNLFIDSELAEGTTAASDSETKDVGDKQEHDNSGRERVSSEASEATGKFKDDEDSVQINEFAPKVVHGVVTSPFATPPDNASSSLSLLHSAAAGMIEKHMENCLHIKAEGNRSCTILLTSFHLILEYDSDAEGFFEGEMLAVQEEAERQRMIDDAGTVSNKDRNGSDDDSHHLKVVQRQREIASLRPKSIRWNLTEVSHVYLRRYRLRDSSLEMFFLPTGGTSFGGFGLYAPTCSLFLDFGPGREGNTRRDEAAFAIMKRSPPHAMKQWPDRSIQFLHDQLTRLTLGWVEGRVSNFDYLLHLNMLAGRSYNDTCNYPVFPWVLSNYISDEVPDLSDRSNFRDLTKPVGALNPARLAEFIERYESFADPSIPAFMYGSHYSTSAGVVLHFLVRLHPFAGLHRQLQSGHFDMADRLFSSVPRTWSMCTGSSAAEVKELTPEWYSNPAFLRNTNSFKLGTSQDGEVLGDVVLPPWAGGSPEKFVEIMRAALESDICSEMLPDWIDLIFGRKQQGPEAVKANNVFFYLTYYNAVDVASIQDEGLRQATELQIAHFGQCPMQLFRRPHVRRIPGNLHRLSFYQLLSSFSHLPLSGNESHDERSEARSAFQAKRSSPYGQLKYLPFSSAPLSHWVHLDAPPPGPHASLVAVRLAGTDRCLAVDSLGVFHSFRWAWRPDDTPSHMSMSFDVDFEPGHFIAQRELPRFKSVPRLLYVPDRGDQGVAVALSKTLFAGRSVLLVFSDGDGCGGIGMQLVDPAKGLIRGEALVPQVHSARITCIATDPIGTAAGHGGVGGELVLFGSEDGSASLWRFMSSHYLPLRPRVRMHGHQGEKIAAVALCASIHVAVSVSSKKCCLHCIGNGNLIRCFAPPEDALGMGRAAGDSQMMTCFSPTPALAVSVQGFIVAVCETTVQAANASDRSMASLHNQSIVTLNLFTVEGIHLGSKPLERWRGLPHKMACTPDGTALMVCCGRGITLHRLSAIQPLEFLEEWMISEPDESAMLGTNPVAFRSGVWDVDLGPSLNRPVIAAAACTDGALRLHALPGISVWSERHKKRGLTQTVGSALSKPARRIQNVVRDGIGLGRQIAGIGRDIGREVTSDVQERGVGGFLGSMVFRKNSSEGKKK